MPFKEKKFFRLVDDEENSEIFRKLRIQGKVSINLGRHIYNVDRSAIFRIRSLFIELRGRDGNILPKDSSREVVIYVILPRIFDDLSPDLKLYTFFSKEPHFCNSIYQVDSKYEKFVENMMLRTFFFL